MAVKLMDLPFAEDALEPVISRETIQYHYGKHHKGYVDNTNALIKGTELDDEVPLIDIVKNSDGALFNNAAQAYNHNFYWMCLTPDPLPPSAKMVELIERDFGSFESFKEQFINAAATLFGSGWAWLELDVNEKLIITQRSNGDTPIIYHHTPLLTMDVWEHAYYIDYRNDRKKYLEALWDLIDWKFVESNIVEYYHDLTEPCKENSELCDFIEGLQYYEEVRT
jgi:Fe-Mn family superoxide dismutase